MNWRFWRRKREIQDKENGTEEFGAVFAARFDALDRAMQAQLTLMDERTRVMARAITAELQALQTVISAIDARLGAIEARGEPSVRRDAGKVLATETVDRDAPLMPPPPANDPPPQKRREIDPMLLDALTKGRVGFSQIMVSSIPPRMPLLVLMDFAAPLPAVDMATTDRLSELFPDAALLLDRLMMDAAASMVRAGQIPPDVPLLIPLSPVSAQDAGLVNDFRRRFERVNHPGGVIPLVSEMGWIALVEAGPERMAELGGPRGSFALRVSGQNRIDHAAIGKLGARYLLAEAALLADAEYHPLAPDIHPTDVARLFARSGVGLVAENVPDQVTALGLLRNNITMGWGPALQADGPTENSSAPPDEARGDYRSYLRRASS